MPTLPPLPGILQAVWLPRQGESFDSLPPCRNPLSTAGAQPSSQLTFVCGCRGEEVSPARKTILRRGMVGCVWKTTRTLCQVIFGKTVPTSSWSLEVMPSSIGKKKELQASHTKSNSDGHGYGACTVPSPCLPVTLWLLMQLLVVFPGSLSQWQD